MKQTKKQRLAEITALADKIQAEENATKKPVFQVYSNDPYVKALGGSIGIPVIKEPMIQPTPDEDFDDSGDYETWAAQERQESGEELRSLRISKGLTQEVIGRAIGVSASKVCNFEKGREVVHGKLMEKAYRMYLDTLKTSVLQNDKKLLRFESGSGQYQDMLYEYEKVTKKCEKMTQFIRSQNLIEQYNLTVMTTRDEHKALGIPVGQRELDTMKSLVDQYNEVKYRLTAIYEMEGTPETDRIAQELYNQTGLEY